MWIKGLLIIIVLLCLTACATDGTAIKGYDRHTYCSQLSTKINSSEDLNTQARQTAINQADYVKTYNINDCQDEEPYH